VQSRDPHEIDATGAWLLRRKEADRALVESIRQVGQLAPALVAREGGRDRLVAGTARLDAARQLGVPVRIRLVEAGDREKGVLFVADNAGQAPGEALLVRCGRFFSGLMPEADMESSVLPLLGLDPRSRPWRLARQWTALPTDWDVPLFEQRLPLAAAPVLVRFTAQELEAVLPLFQGLSWSRGNALRLLEWLLAVSRREDRTPEEVLQRVKARELLKVSLSPKDTMEALLTRLRNVRYPELTRLERRFGATSTGLTRGRFWRLSPEQHFETGRVRLEAVAGSRKDLRRAVVELERLAEQEEWQLLWSLGREEPGT
ncbi:MAG: ParB N-terminal domain-containing protein, partial [Desulfohalobiaceae bacterium]